MRGHKNESVLLDRLTVLEAAGGYFWTVYQQAPPLLVLETDMASVEYKDDIHTNTYTL